MAKSNYKLELIANRNLKQFIQDVNQNLKAGYRLESHTLNFARNYYEVYMTKNWAAPDPKAPQIDYVQAKNPSELERKLMYAVDNGAAFLGGFKHDQVLGNEFSLFIFIWRGQEHQGKCPRLKVVQSLSNFDRKVTELMNKGYVMTEHYDQESQAVLMYEIPKKFEKNGMNIELVPEK